MKLYSEDVCKTVVAVRTCISPQALYAFLCGLQSPQPPFSCAPALDSLEMMAAMRAGSTPCLCPTLLIMDLYWLILPLSVFAISCDALTPCREKKKTLDYCIQATKTPVGLSVQWFRFFPVFLFLQLVIESAGCVSPLQGFTWVPQLVLLSSLPWSSTGLNRSDVSITCTCSVFIWLPQRRATTMAKLQH